MTISIEIHPFVAPDLMGATKTARDLDSAREGLGIEYRVLRTPSKEPVARELAQLSVRHDLSGSELGRACSRQALRFLVVLPSWAPAPEVALDPDGEIAFDWSAGEDMISVSVGPFGRLVYVWAIGDEEGSNTGVFASGLPPDLYETLRKIG